MAISAIPLYLNLKGGVDVTNDVMSYIYDSLIQNPYKCKQNGYMTAMRLHRLLVNYRIESQSLCTFPFTGLYLT